MIEKGRDCIGEKIYTFSSVKVGTSYSHSSPTFSQAKAPKVRSAFKHLLSPDLVNETGLFNGGSHQSDLSKMVDLVEKEGNISFSHHQYTKGGHYLGNVFQVWSKDGVREIDHIFDYSDLFNYLISSPPFSTCIPPPPPSLPPLLPRITVDLVRITR